MQFDWSEYESDSDTEEVSLLLSVKSQSLILAAMQSLQFRSNWLEVDDATYDDIEASVAEAYEEIMLQVESGGTMTPMAVHVARDASQAIAAATPTFVSWDTLVYQYSDVIWSSGNPTEFIIPTGGAGWWLITGTLQLSGTTVVQNRFVEILVNGTGKYMTWENGNNQSGNQLSHAQYLADGDIVKIRITCAGAVTLLGTTGSGVRSCAISLSRIYDSVP